MELGLAVKQMANRIFCVLGTNTIIRRKAGYMMQRLPMRPGKVVLYVVSGIKW